MRILFLTQYYPPETGAAPLRAYHFATKLAKRGHSVTVVTGMPNHPSGVKPPEYRGRLSSREDRDGVHVRRSYLFATARKTFATRMLNQLTFMVTAFFSGLFAGRCDVILVTSPPLFLGASAWLLGLLKGVPTVLDVRDYWPHAAVALGQLRSSSAIRLAERLERFLYRRSARIVAVTPSMKRLMLERGIPAHRIDFVPNGADLESFSPAAATGAAPADRRAEGDGRWTVLYSGTHGLVHGMEVIIEAAELLRSDDRLRFLMVGDGVAKEGLVAEASRRSLANVEFAPSRQPRDLADTIRSADVCVATTTGGDFSSGVIPVKMFDYMACGKPIAAAVSGDAREIIEAAGAGIVVEPGDARGLADAIRSLVDDQSAREAAGTRGREFVSREYSRGSLAERMEDVLTGVVAAEGALGASSFRLRHYLAAKYLVDAGVAAVVLAVTSPLFLLIALLIKLDSPGRAVFTQRRVGVYCEEFNICKFRTMERHTPDLATDLMMGSPRDYTTRMGRFLRRTSLDELPNLLNILKGEMSIVGPRPALYNQHELIEMRRQVGADILRPGLTGWAQINGRDSIPLDEKVRLDEFYVRNCSFLLDIKILFRTASVMSNPEE
jgi:lipopolysaccharide/colanic/teichoic acid biosynthesis glycosyltransferase/glycosyltransferase involved in cell wall biosynthesis